MSCAMMAANEVVVDSDAFSRETAAIYDATKGIWDDVIVSQVINWKKAQQAKDAATGELPKEGSWDSI